MHTETDPFDQIYAPKQQLVDQIANSTERTRDISHQSRHERNERIRNQRRKYLPESDGLNDEINIDPHKQFLGEYTLRSKELRRNRTRFRHRRINPYHNHNHTAASKEDLIGFEKANLKPYMEHGGWMDINKISKDSFIYKHRTKHINITDMLNSNDTVNVMEKYNFSNDNIRNDKWNEADINKLMEDKNKLFEQYGIVPYESKMSYDLQLVEYDIFSWIINHQHPIECPRTYFEIGILNECGFGCKLDDYILICAKFALFTGYIFEFRDWGNSKDTLHEYGAWNEYFRPVSNVLSVCNKQELDILRQGMYRERPNKIGFWVPEQFEERIEALHNDAVLYFNGILDRYLLRLNKKYIKQYNAIKTGFSYKHPLIGCHVRRTDKIMESNVYEWNNYIDLVEYLLRYNDISYETENGVELALFLATDDKNIVKTAMSDDFSNGLKFSLLYNKYSIYIGNMSEEIVLKQRRTDNALRSIVFDVLLLSECDLFVGQDGSRVSRLVLELIAMRLPDYKQRLISIDAVNNNRLDFPYWISDNWLH